MRLVGAGKGGKRRTGEDPKAFSAGWDNIDWSKKDAPDGTEDTPEERKG